MNFLEISSVNFFLWIAFGVTVGHVIHRRDHRKVTGGLFVTILFSIIGALIGGYLTSFLMGKAMLGLSIQGLFIAGITALAMTLFYRSSFGDRQYIKTISLKKG